MPGQNDCRKALLSLNTHDILSQALSRGFVKITQRLVNHQHLRINRQSSCQSHTERFDGRQSINLLVLQAVDTEPAQSLGNTRPPLGSGHFPHLQAKFHIGINRVSRPKTTIARNPCNPPLFWRNSDHVAAIKIYLAIGIRLKPCQCPAKHRFATARSACDQMNRSRTCLEINVIKKDQSVRCQSQVIDSQANHPNIPYCLYVNALVNLNQPGTVSKSPCSNNLRVRRHRWATHARHSARSQALSLTFFSRPPPNASSSIAGSTGCGSF